MGKFCGTSSQRTNPNAEFFGDAAVSKRGNARKGVITRRGRPASGCHLSGGKFGEVKKAPQSFDRSHSRGWGSENEAPRVRPNMSSVVGRRGGGPYGARHLRVARAWRLVSKETASATVVLPLNPSDVGQQGVTTGVQVAQDGVNPRGQRCRRGGTV